VLYNVLLFAGVIIALSVSFGEWSVFARVQVMQDFGLATMSISGLLLAVFVGVGMLDKEMSGRTVYTLATKPVHRYTIIVGKYVGLTTTLLLNFGVMTLLFLATLWSMGGGSGLNVLPAVLLIWVEMAVVVAVSVLFSTFTNATLAAILTIAFYIAGHFNDLKDVVAVEGRHPWLVDLLHGLYYVLPNLEHFNIRSRVVYDLPVPSGFVGTAVLYGCLYVALFLLLSCAVFGRRDL
ncbi:MAG: ABC transporter permease subunit, partial [Chitinivibrionales bacterium]|nr:ABC transporter permease subunit [Chitinivibrionales bacterium]MBD3357640.1 ABC transporter permease subunit [Chitinivibrionales bacterium]